MKTGKELKEMIKKAYALPTTDNEKSFIQRYEKRSLQILDVIKLEFRYMGLQSILAGGLFCLVCLLILKMEDTDMMWAFSAMIPFVAVIPMILLSKSERYGMDEMEASSRFSLRFMRLVRMCIIGALSFVLFLSVGIIMKVCCAFTMIDYLICVITPYLVSDLGAMLVARRWHGKENIFGIFAVCILSCLVPFLVKTFRQSGYLPDVAVVALAVVLLIAVIRECVKYVKESENVSWNLC